MKIMIFEANQTGKIEILEERDRSEIAGSYSNSFFNFLRKFLTIFHK